jgi:hypothetical protein
MIGNDQTDFSGIANCQRIGMMLIVLSLVNLKMPVVKLPALKG